MGAAGSVNVPEDELPHVARHLRSFVEGELTREELSPEERAVYEHLVVEYRKAHHLLERRISSASPHLIADSLRLFEENMANNDREDWNSDEEYNRLRVGDIVRARDPDGSGLWFEGILTDSTSNGQFEVVLDDGSIEVTEENIQRVRPWDSLEIGDTIQYAPVSSFMSFVGTIVKLNPEDGTFDLYLEGDPVEETVRNVEKKHLRKIGSVRAQKKWKKAKNSLFATLRFSNTLAATPNATV